MRKGTGRFKLDQTIAAQRRFENALASLCLRRAKRESMTHAAILDERAALYARPEYARLPSWAKGQLDATFRAYMEAIHALGLVTWRLTLDGIPRSSAAISDLADQAERRGECRAAVWNRVVGGHVWAHTGLPFNPPEPVCSEAAKVA